MSLCEANGVDTIFGLSRNAVLDRLVEAAANAIRVRPAEGRHAPRRGYAGTRCAAKLWATPRRSPGRSQREAENGSAETIYEPLYRARGKAET